ncbi:MAG: glycosyltransferase family 4 protein [Mycobacteriales bacterium]
MRILIWHGYLLDGTGSNIYTRSLARVWSEAGHEVVVLSQEPRPERFDLGGARTVRPDIGPLLPVFVLDRYAGLEPRLLTQMSTAERDRFVSANVEAVRAEGEADLLFANHVLLGAAVGAASSLPYAVKAHGSELEFAMRGNAELCDWAREAMSTARLVIAGSEHIRDVLDDVPGRGDYSERVRVIPPGVDISEMSPGDRGSALAGLVAESRRDEPSDADEEHDGRSPDPGNAQRVSAFLDGDRPTVVYVGKLSEEKGVSLLLEAVRRLDARAVIVGFGPARQELEASASEHVLFTGPLEHRHLRHLWRFADVSVVPSVFPEAFGMVAAEAAACGCLPLVARHSGLAEIAAGLEEEYPVPQRHLAAFRTGDVDDLTDKLGQLLALSPPDRTSLSAAARQAAVKHWSWEHVAARILEEFAAAGG